MLSSRAPSLAVLRRVARRGGFTFVELLTVVVIVGLLAAIAIPKFVSTKERAYVVTMKADLKNMASTNEAWYAEHRTYEGMPTPSGSPLVTLSMSATANGWSAHAKHASSATQCDVQVGSAVVAPNNDGEPFCQ